jgi:hypothetical protein
MNMLCLLQYKDYLPRAVGAADVLGTNYGDTAERRGQNVVYTSRSGRRQDLWLLGPRPVRTPPKLMDKLLSWKSKKIWQTSHQIR